MYNTKCLKPWRTLMGQRVGTKRLLPCKTNLLCAQSTSCRYKLLTWRPSVKGAKPPPVPTGTFWSISMAELSVLIALEKFPALEPHRGLDPARRSALDPSSYTWVACWLGVTCDPSLCCSVPPVPVGLFTCSKLGTGLSILLDQGHTHLAKSSSEYLVHFLLRSLLGRSVTWLGGGSCSKLVIAHL